MWQTGGPTRTSPDYNCEVANPACQTTLGYPPVAVRLVGGGATSHWRLVRNGLPSSPSLISIRLTAWTWITVYIVPPSQGRGGVNTHTHTHTRQIDTGGYPRVVFYEMLGEKLHSCNPVKYGCATCLPHKGGGVPLVPCPRTQQASLPACSPHYPLFYAERQAGKLWIPFFKVFWFDLT